MRNFILFLFTLFFVSFVSASPPHDSNGSTPDYSYSCAFDVGSPVSILGTLELQELNTQFVVCKEAVTIKVSGANNNKFYCNSFNKWLSKDITLQIKPLQSSLLAKTLTFDNSCNKWLMC